MQPQLICTLTCLLLAALAGCAGTPGPDGGLEGGSAKATPLRDGTWQLTGLGPIGKPESLPDGAAVTLVIDTENGQVSGGAGCNQYVGKFTQEGDTLKIGPLAMTKKYCPVPEGLMALESAYAQALESATRSEVDADRLRLLYGENLALVFAPADATP
jgi:heat shock protein HslJ